MCKSAVSGAADAHVSHFVQQYMGPLFYFCLKKTGDAYEAEDLTQDIALNVCEALLRGTVPESFPAWVWQIARNRYSVWAKDKHRRAMADGGDVEAYELADDSADVTAELMHKEELALLRRELAFIRCEYRTIVVAYYLKDHSVHRIAREQGLREDAVKKRLQRARNILKEGMYMARQFGKRSYDPEDVRFVKSGSDGDRGQPWSIVGHLLYKNIFLAADQNPMSAEELALEIGVALPYMEDELRFLTAEQLLREQGGKYVTNFAIISKSEQWATHQACREIAPTLTARLCELIDTYMREDGSRVDVSFVGYEVAKWSLLIYTLDQLEAEARTLRGEAKQPFPARPDGGRWVLTGYEIIDWSEPAFIGQHIASAPLNDGQMPIDFGQFKMQRGDYYGRTPCYLAYPDAYALWQVASGCAEDELDAHCVRRLLEFGYLVRCENGTLAPAVVIFDAKAPPDGKHAAHLSALKQEILALLQRAPAIERGYIVEQAIADGWLQDTDAKTVGAYLFR